LKIPQVQKCGIIRIPQLESEEELLSAMSSAMIERTTLVSLGRHCNHTRQEGYSTRSVTVGCWVLGAAAVLTSVRAEHSCSEITADVVQNTHDLIEKQTANNTALAIPNTMYHRADRRTMIFSNEPEITKILEIFGYDLVVLCPLMPASGMGWGHFWNAENRSPIRFRYGPGEQCRNKFLVLACFPVFRGSGAQGVHWLTVTSTGT
jgi:hypothetical protein